MNSLIQFYIKNIGFLEANKYKNIFNFKLMALGCS